MRGLPPLTALSAFEAAARRRSFKRAAEELGVTPTAISHQIRQLEDLLGQPLFRRRPRPLTLTAAGAELFPVLRDGLDRFEAAVAVARRNAASRPLRVTATNAFAHRWLVPRLGLWRELHPEVPLEIVGSDTVLDLTADEADLAIRYALHAPPDATSYEFLRDSFYPVCRPSLLAERPVAHPRDLMQHTLIHLGWSPTPYAPTWARWFDRARLTFTDLPEIDLPAGMHFKEELHGIEAVVAGQGIAVCSDVLVGRELVDKTLVKVIDLALPGLGFYLVHRPGSPREPTIHAFLAWLRSLV